MIFLGHYTLLFFHLRLRSYKNGSNTKVNSDLSAHGDAFQPSALTAFLELCSTTATHKKLMSVVCVVIKACVLGTENHRNRAEDKKSLISTGSIWIHGFPRHSEYVSWTSIITKAASFTQTVLGLLAVLKNALFKANLAVPLT